MKNLFGLIAVLALVAFNQASFAEEPPAPKPAMKMEGSMGAPMDHAKMLEHMKMEQEHMLKMHDLSNKILTETDPKKQQELKDQQLKLMEEQHEHKMKMMKNHKMPM
ncbi:MAG: hypothetical protein ABL919_16385 [Methylococcales bacterium]|jgi:hypothetical protein|nr:hypothetical protein [Methylococcaceae bacterium]